MKTYGIKIAEKREAAGLSQSELAKKLGWPQSRIGNYESEARGPKEEDLRQIAKVLGLSFDELVCDDPPEGKPLSANDFEARLKKLNKKGLIVLMQKSLARLQELSD